MKSKTCRKCKVEKPETEFFFSGHVTLAGKKIRDTLCKPCKVVYKREQRKKVRDWIKEIKENSGCAKCGYSKETHPSFKASALTFHHAQDNKEFWIADSPNRGYSRKTIQKEIDKCVLICVRCHAEIHSHE